VSQGEYAQAASLAREERKATVEIFPPACGGGKSAVDISPGMEKRGHYAVGKGRSGKVKAVPGGETGSDEKKKNPTGMKTRMQ